MGLAEKIKVQEAVSLAMRVISIICLIEFEALAGHHRLDLIMARNYLGLVCRHQTR